MTLDGRIAQSTLALAAHRPARQESGQRGNSSNQRRRIMNQPNMSFSGFVDAGEVNTMDTSALDTLHPATRALVERRSKVMGPAYRLHYAKPLHLVRGTGTRLFDADGVESLDAYNNVASLGHGHPRVIEAMMRQLTMPNTNTRYLQ